MTIISLYRSIYRDIFLWNITIEENWFWVYGILNEFSYLWNSQTPVGWNQVFLNIRNLENQRCRFLIEDVTGHRNVTLTILLLRQFYKWDDCEIDEFGNGRNWWRWKWPLGLKPAEKRSINSGRYSLTMPHILWNYWLM